MALVRLNYIRDGNFLDTCRHGEFEQIEPLR